MNLGIRRKSKAPPPTTGAAHPFAPSPTDSPKATPPAAPLPPAAPPPPTGQRGDKEQMVLNAEMIGRLDSFLDELAVGHRAAMDQVVTWLTGYGDLDREVQRSVEALNPLLQKWSIEICFLLRMKQPRRFNELKDGLPGIGSRTLSQRLKELEAQGIVSRTVIPEVPVRVEYRLTPKGLRMGDLFLPIIAHLRIAGWRENRGDKASGPAAKV